MALTVDPEFIQAVGKFSALISSIEPIAPGDALTRREVGERVLRAVLDTHPMPDDVLMEDFLIRVSDESSLLLRWYHKKDSNPGSAIVYIHGGGLIFNTVEIYDKPVSKFVSDSGVPFLSVDYRKAPEYPYPTPVKDCYTAFTWLVEHAESLGIDPARIAIMGDSAGGGLAAAIAIKSRDNGGPALAKQILIYPMLDDRTTLSNPILEPFVIWSPEDNLTAWQAYLGSATGTKSVSPYAAAAHLKDASGLPPAYIDVGELDIFRDEDIQYARLLADAGVSTELHVHPGVTHSWEFFAPEIAVSQRAHKDRIRAIQSI